MMVACPCKTCPMQEAKGHACTHQTPHLPDEQCGLRWCFVGQATVQCCPLPEPSDLAGLARRASA